MRNTDDEPIDDPEPPAKPRDDRPTHQGDGPNGPTPFVPEVPDPRSTPSPADPLSGTHGSGDSGEAIPTPREALWGNLTDPFNNTTVPHRAKNAFGYGEILGRILHGWRIKALSFLFAPSNATKIEVAATRGTIKGIGKGLVFVAPLSAVVDFVDVFRKNLMGSPAFYQNYGIAGLGAIGGILGGAAFDAFGFGVLASLGLTGAGLFVAAPIIFGLVGAGILQVAGAAINQGTRQGSFFYKWFPDSFLDRCVSSVLSWFSGLRGTVAQALGRDTPLKYLPTTPTSDDISNHLHDPTSSRRRPPPPSGLPFPPERRGPDNAAGINDGGDDGGARGRVARPSVPVGGVLFENCHTVLTGIEELTGAYWDEGARSLVLIGTESADAGKRNIELPAMDADQLKVALRAAITGDSLGVSIDAPATFRYAESGRRMPPTGTPFLVSYLGGCDRTLTGAIFFEADRIMKCLSMGVHNETHQPFQAHVAGFRSTFDLHGQSNDSEGSSWHRFWFVVDRVELRRAAGTDALTFGDVRIAIQTELELRGTSPGQFSDPLDAQFARHLTSHYDEYAKEFPVLGRLKELAKMSAIAQFLIDRDVDLDLGDLLDHLPTDVSTPETTPSLLRSELSRTIGGVRSHAMSGGVDLAITPSYREDLDGVAKSMRDLAFSARAAASLDWSFRLGNASLRANAIELGAARRVRHVETDHEFPLIQGLPRLRLERIYEPKASENGMFGPRWNAFVPLSLTLLRGSGKRHDALDPKDGTANTRRPIIALRHYRSGNIQIYRFLVDIDVNGHPAWGRVTRGSTASGGVSFKYDPADLIYEQDGRFVLDQNSRKYYFDGTGRLVEISCDAGKVAGYVWVANRLERLENEAGQGYSFLYSETSEVATVQISDGQTVHYLYGPQSHLREVHIGGQRQFTYRYDLAQRLNEVSDASGTITGRFYYSAVGGLLRNRALDTFTLPDGRTISRSFASERLSSLSEEAGALAEFNYGARGHMQSVFVRGRDGLNWRLEYGINGKLHRIFDPLGRTTEFECDDSGVIERVILPDKTALAAKRDDHGTVLEITSSGNQGWKAIYDTDGLLNTLRGPITPKVQVQRSLRGIAVIKIVGESRAAIPERRSFLNAHRRNQLDTYEFSERMSRRLAGRHRVKRALAADGRSLTTLGPAGAVRVSAPPNKSAFETVEFFVTSKEQP